MLAALLALVLVACFIALWALFDDTYETGFRRRRADEERQAEAERCAEERAAWLALPLSTRVACRVSTVLGCVAYALIGGTLMAAALFLAYLFLA